MNLLFVCSRNQWRSPTAETVYRRRSGISVRSAGTAKSARRSVRADDINWADMVFVMEDKHKKKLRQDFRDQTNHATIHVLDISDDYEYMEPELVEILRSKIDGYLI